MTKKEKKSKRPPGHVWIKLPEDADREGQYFTIAEVNAWMKAGFVYVAGDTYYIGRMNAMAK